MIKILKLSVFDDACELACHERGGALCLTEAVSARAYLEQQRVGGKLLIVGGGSQIGGAAECGVLGVQPLSEL